MRKSILIVLLFLLLTGCTFQKTEESREMTTQVPLPSDSVSDEIIPSESVVYTRKELLNPLINPKDNDFVRVKDYIPNVTVELKYAGEDNFTGQKIYDFEDVFLRYGTVMKLKAVSEEFAEQGLYLKIWDGFRPVSAQFKLWEICPDDTYVADPNKGFSNHSRGFAVDLTLVDADGRELEMPTGFDDFSEMADRDYSEAAPAAAENARMLESVMEKYGFTGYWGEWWHFNDTQRYDVETCFDPGVIGFRILGEESHLLEHFSEPESRILTIPEGETVTLLGYDEEYSLVEYWGYRGYIPTKLHHSFE